MKVNLFPIRIDFDEFQVYTEPYSQERLAELRVKYNSSHSFFRNGDLIYISNKDGQDNLTLGTLAKVKTYDNGGEIAASLIKHLFFRTFKGRFSDRIPTDFYPFRFFSLRPEDDLVASMLPDHLKGMLAYKKQIEVQLRLTKIDGVPRFGFLISVRRNWIFSKSCEVLHGEGFPLIGCDVLHSEIFPGLANVLAPSEEFVGVIKQLNGDMAIVETSTGNQEFPLKELFLKKSNFNIRSYLTFSTGAEKSDQIMRAIKAKGPEVHNTKRAYEEVLKIAQSLFAFREEGTHQSQQVLFANKDGFCFTADTAPLDVTNSIILKETSFIFDHAATRQHSTTDAGLTTFGPYDSLTFDIKSPTILCICHKENRGSFTKFLAELRDGIPTSQYFKKGFQKKYDLKNVNFVIKEIPYYDLSEYVKQIVQNDVKPDAAIVEIPGEWKEQRDATNPYYPLKAKLLGMEIPAQFVTYERVRSSNEYILNSIGLQLYAKLGGVPWVLPTNRSTDREIIIGIGHSWLRDKAYVGAANNRIVGITTFLASDGQYLLSDKAKDVKYEDYFNELLRSLRSSMHRLEQEQAWAEGDTIRLIFHIFKPIKNVEFDVVSELVKEIQRFKIQFAFITISKEHPYLLFDTNQPGVNKYGQKKGEYIPQRATNVFLDSSTCLIQMLGVRQLKAEFHGMSGPLLIRIRLPQGKHENQELDGMLFTDLSYIVQQIYSFTYLSWRSFLPGEQPATMFYSSLIAKMISRLRQVQGWDPDSLNYKLKKKKWFL